MQEIFGPDGLIAQAHPEYEHRPGQIEMAQAVLRAFEEKRHLIVEAGTGTVFHFPRDFENKNDTINFINL